MRVVLDRAPEWAAAVAEAIADHFFARVAPIRFESINSDRKRKGNDVLRRVRMFTCGHVNIGTVLTAPSRSVPEHFLDNGSPQCGEDICDLLNESPSACANTHEMAAGLENRAGKCKKAQGGSIPGSHLGSCRAPGRPLLPARCPA